MRLIIPCAGRSSRFPNDAPKWMLPDHAGRPMLQRAVEHLAREGIQTVVAILSEHEDRFGAMKGIHAALGDDVEVVVLPKPTASQPETVAQTLAIAGVDEPFLVKDSDNAFDLEGIETTYNYVCVDSLNSHDAINPRNKSYVQVDHAEVITNIREKEVISDLFAVGGYYFTDPELYLAHYEKLARSLSDWHRELYLSDVIGSMILDGIPFRARRVSHYHDWGTIHEWRNELRSRRAFFVQLDGFLFERGSEFFEPTFEDVRPHAEAGAFVRKALDEGHTVTCLTVRPERLANMTERQLRKAGLAGLRVLYDCPSALWLLVASPHPTSPYQPCGAVELQPDDPYLDEKLFDG